MGMKRLITERNVEEFKGRELDPREYIITPLARDRFKELNIRLKDQKRDRLRDPLSHLAFEELKRIGAELYGADKGERLAEEALRLLSERYLLTVVPKTDGVWEVAVREGKVVEVRRREG